MCLHSSINGADIFTLLQCVTVSTLMALSEGLSASQFIQIHRCNIYIYTHHENPVLH